MILLAATMAEILCCQLESFKPEASTMIPIFIFHRPELSPGKHGVLPPNHGVPRQLLASGIALSLSKALLAFISA